MAKYPSSLGLFPLVVTWRVVARRGKYPPGLRLNCDVSIARRGIRATLPRRHRYSSPGFKTSSSYPPEAKERTMKRLMILNGPNLNLLGVREPHIYGTTTLASIKASCEEFARFAGAQLSFHQSNNEGVLVDIIQSAREQADAIIINPAGYSFTSIAI